MAALGMSSREVMRLLDVGRYWTVDPKSDKMEALAVPTALQDSLVSHSGSLATASVLFTLAAPLQVRLHYHDTSAASPSSRCHTSCHWSGLPAVLIPFCKMLRLQLGQTCQILPRYLQCICTIAISYCANVQHNTQYST